MHKWISAPVLGLSLLFSLACLPVQAAKHVQDVSGIAHYDGGRFLAVSDTKAHNPKPRLWMGTITGDKCRFKPVPIEGWETMHTRSSDLEGICAVPDSSNIFLVTESGYFKGQGGRVFRLSINAEDRSHPIARCLDYFRPFPIPEDGGPAYRTPDHLQIEGIEALPHPQGGYVLLLGLRGNGDNPSALVYGHLKDGQFQELGRTPIDLRHIIEGCRSCSDLHLIKSDGDTYRVLSVATTDPGELGPFTSAICEVGTFDGKALTFTPCEPKVIQRVPGFKVEALGRTPEIVSGSELLIGSDDEGYGGIVRPLPSTEPARP